MSTVSPLFHKKTAAKWGAAHLTLRRFFCKFMERLLTSNQKNTLVGNKFIFFNFPVKVLHNFLQFSAKTLSTQHSICLANLFYLNDQLFYLWVNFQVSEVLDKGQLIWKECPQSIFTNQILETKLSFFAFQCLFLTT